MAKMINLNSPHLIEAVCVWTGWGQSMMPIRRNERLAVHFGNEIASKLFPLIKSIEDDFYSSNARFVAANLQEMEQLASEQFRRNHPTVADGIVKAFAWCYTFDFK